MASIEHAIECIVQTYPVLVERSKRFIVNLVGAPGIGKSSAVYQAAERLSVELSAKLKKQVTVVVRELRIGGRDPADIAGYRIVSGEKTIATLPDWWPTADELFGILFLDELAQGMLASMNALSEIMLDHRLGEFLLPPGWVVVAASNRKADRAGVNRVPSQIQDRMLTLNIEVDVDEAKTYAIEHDWYDAIVSYWNYRPAHLHHLDDQGFGSTQRSWEVVSDLEKADLSPDVTSTLIAAAIGGEVSATYAAFKKYQANLPDLKDLIADPQGWTTDYKPEITYALIGALSTVMAKDPSYADAIITYLRRLPQQEFAFCCIADAERFSAAAVKRGEKVKALTTSKEFSAWIVENRDVYMI